MNSFGSVEISITNWAEKTDKATKLEYSVSGIEKCTVERVAIVAKGQAAKDFKIGTNTRMKKCLRCDKCGKYIYLIPAFLNQFTGATRAQGGADEEGEEICSLRTYWMLKILSYQWVQSELLRFLFPLHLKKLMRLPSCQNFHKWAIPCKRSETKGQRQKVDFFLMKCER